MTAGNNKIKHIIYIIIFIIYLAVLLYFTVFAESLGRIPGENQGNYTGYNLIPFNEIRRFIKYRELLGFKAVALNIAGNFAAFMPAGFMLPNLSRKTDGLLPVFFGGMAISLLIELAQFIFRVGSFDVDDIMLNTLGAAAGWFLYRAFLGKRDAG